MKNNIQFLGKIYSFGGKPIIECNDWKEFVKYLPIGTIVFLEPNERATLQNDFIGKIIQNLRPNESHEEMVINIGHDYRGRINDYTASAELSGFRRCNLHRFFSRPELNLNFVFNIKWKPFDQQKLMDEIFKIMGTKPNYDFWGIVRQAYNAITGNVLGKDNADAWYCSEVIATILLRAGFDTVPENIDIHLLDPGRHYDYLMGDEMHNKGYFRLGSVEYV